MKEENYFSKNLEYLRKSRNITQSELANKIGVDQTTIGRWEDGNREPTVGNVSNIAKYFGVSIPNLLDKDLSKESDNKIDDNIQVLLDAYQGLSDSDKEFMKNMIIERRKQIDKELGDNENN